MVECLACVESRVGLGRGVALAIVEPVRGGSTGGDRPDSRCDVNARHTVENVVD